MITKLRTASTTLHRWQSPAPVDPESTPVLTVKAGGNAVAGIDALAVVAGPATIASISSDTRTLTASEAILASERATGEGWGEAHYVSDEDGVIPVRVQSINGSTIILTEPLHKRVSAGGELIWCSHWTLFTAADATATARRDVTWGVAYQPLLPGSAAGEAAPRVDGPFQLVVVDSPFNTGLTTARVNAFYPEIGQTLPSRDADRAAYIDQAAEWLIQDLRKELRPRGYWEDDVDGSGFSLPHLYLTAALIIERTDPERAKELRARYHSTLASALRAAQVDLDGDGVPDEDSSRLSGPITLQSATISSMTTPPRWGRGSYH